jgi:hypothetical protein
VAIISPSNGPIYIRQFDRDASSTTSDLRYHYFAHAALDVMDERSQTSKASEQYLGLLYTLEDLALYGLQTNTRLRFVIMLTLSDHVVRDIDMLTLFRALHTAYLRYAANPFHMFHPLASQIGADVGVDGARALLERHQVAHLAVNCRPIRSVAFDRTVDQIVLGHSVSRASHPDPAPTHPTPYSIPVVSAPR